MLSNMLQMTILSFSKKAEWCIACTTQFNVDRVKYLTSFHLSCAGPNIPELIPINHKI